MPRRFSRGSRRCAASTWCASRRRRARTCTCCGSCAAQERSSTLCRRASSRELWPPAFARAPSLPNRLHRGLIDDATIDRVLEPGVPVNAGSEDMLTQLGERRRGHPVWLRINPGFGHGHSHKVNTGGESSKHGIWHENLGEALRASSATGSTWSACTCTSARALTSSISAVCDAMVRAVQRAGRDVRAISGGGGLPIPYREGEAPIDPSAHFAVWDKARRRIEAHLGHRVTSRSSRGATSLPRRECCSPRYGQRRPWATTTSR